MAEINTTDAKLQVSERPRLKTQRTLPSGSEDYRISGQKPPCHPNTKSQRRKLKRTDTITFGGPLEMIVPLKGRHSETDDRMKVKTNPPIKVESADEHSVRKEESFAGFVKKHMSNIRKMAGIKYMQKSSLKSDSFYSSCPNLNEQMNRHYKISKFGLSRSSEAGINRNQSGELPPGNNSHILESSKLLVVPDLFTTSYTYSASTDEAKSGFLAPERETYVDPPARQSSAPAKLGQRILDQKQPNLKQSLKKSLSDNPYSRKFSSEQPIPCSAPLTDFTAEPIATEIIEWLYLGNIESAYNERLLCKLNISSMVDMSGLNPEEVPVSKKCEVPCLCNLTNKHARARLCVNISETYGEDVEDDFDQINKFVEGGRVKGRGVLIHCFTGTNAAAAAVIQYLMQCQGMNLRKAYNTVMKKTSNLDLSPYFQHKLEVLEKRLFSGDPPTMQFRQKLVKKDSLVPKEAWTEC